MGSLVKGHRTYGTPELQGDMNNVIIGNYCSIAPNVKIDCGWNHATDLISTFPFHSLPHAGSPNMNTCKGDVIIGSDVWIGMDSIIGSGVTIGHGSVIGTRSFISKDVEPYSIMVGANRLIKKRFSPLHIEKLLEIAWWDWPEPEVILAVPFLNTRDVEGLWNHYINRIKK